MSKVYPLQPVRNPLDLLRELHALVKGEAPSLLSDDSGGDGALALEIEMALDLPEPGRSTRGGR